MDRTIIVTDRSPAAIGPYSQATVAGGFVFCSGQIPLDLQGQVIEGDITTQTLQVLTNLKALLEASGSSLEKVMKTTVFLADMNDFAAMNAVYGQFFTQNPPARSTIQVARLPRDVRIEIEAIALA
jgi:2-iminobutanoate/2-iminopropanoate deaminase